VAAEAPLGVALRLAVADEEDARRFHKKVS
jgi:hypothetical protein